MTTSTRLILSLTVVASIVLSATSYVNFSRRQDSLKAAMRSQVLAHAYTLQVALEDLFKAERAEDAERLIRRLSNNPYLFRLILFDKEGKAQTPPAADLTDDQTQNSKVAQVIASGEKVEYVHSVNGQEYFSVILPIELGLEGRGAFEIEQPTDLLQADISRTRRNYAITLFIILFSIFVIGSIVLRWSLARPIKALLEGTSAIGRGELNYRVNLPAQSGEFAQLATEFNRMADNLVAQREAAAREAEQRLELERELRHRDRLVLTGRLAASVAHEMGTPLNVIDGRAAQLLDQPEATVEMRQRNLTIIRAQASRITRVVRQLLNLARSQEVHYKYFDLVQTINEVGELIEADASRAGVAVEIDAEKPAWIKGDQGLLQQVFLNICLNGIQAMPFGGRLRVECQADSFTKDNQDYTVVRIADTGTGVTPEHLQQIFEPFFTTKDVGQGTGLGLAVSRRIVEDHGGWIEAANREDGPGAVFTIALPQVQAALQSQPQKAVARQEMR